MILMVLQTATAIGLPLVAHTSQFSNQRRDETL
jgi:hypothetical protein